MQIRPGRRIALPALIAVALMLALGGVAAAQVTSGEDSAPDETPADIVIADDLIVEGSVCASDSFLCVDGENFDNGIFTGEFLAKDTVQPGIAFVETSTGKAWGAGMTAQSGFGITDIVGVGATAFPFQVLPDSSASTLVVAPNRRVGIGTQAPNASLQVAGTEGNALIRVDENSKFPANRFLLRLENSGAPKFSFLNSASGDGWQFSMDANNHFIIDYMNSGGQELQIRRDGSVKMGPGNANNFFLDPSGNLTIAGVLTENSDLFAKTDIASVDTASVLDRVAALPLFTWRYGDSAGTHLGPMAQDFYSAFGLGATDTGISTLDTSGVALASIQELHQLTRDQAAYIETLEERLAELEGAVQALTEQD